MSPEILKTATEVAASQNTGEVPKFEDAEKTISQEGVAEGGDENIPAFDEEANEAEGDSLETNSNELNDTRDAVEDLGLTDDQKDQVKEETGWSDEIIDHIDSMDQYDILKNAGLEEREINGRPCLVKENLDLDEYRDPKTNMTNRERLTRQPPPPGAGPLSPIDPVTGEKIELHHLGQDKDGPFVELTVSEHRGPGNHAIMHPRHEDSWRNGENNFEQEKNEHWQERAKGE